MNDLYTNIIKVSGKNIENFFQNLITNDIKKLKNSLVLYSALLSPQGKYINDFFIIKLKDNLLIECNKNKTNILINEFKKYDIRNDINFTVSKSFITKVIIKEFIDKEIYEKLQDNKLVEENGYVFYEDPRNDNFLIRFIFDRNHLNINNYQFSKENEVDLRRIKLKIPNSEKDLIENKCFILNYNFKNISAISFDKGCFIGQENTARQNYRGKQKYSLETIKLISGLFPDIHQDIFFENRKIGTMKSSNSNFGLCLIKNDDKARSLKEIKTDSNMLFRII